MPLTENVAELKMFYHGFASMNFPFRIKELIFGSNLETHLFLLLLVQR